MKVVDNKSTKKFIKELKRLNKNIKIETARYGDSIILIDNFNAQKVKLPANWHYDARLGFIHTDTSRNAELGGDNMSYIRSANMELKRINDVDDLARELQRVNPLAQIKVDYSSNEPKITSSIGLDKLNYPENFYYNEKNGITNKHNTRGQYINVDIERVASVIDDNLKLLSELRILNPNANIKIDPLELVNGDLSKISSNISADKLTLPDGFEYDEKNGITNKHHTTTGTYISCAVEHSEINDAYDMARELVDLNANLAVELRKEGERIVIKTSEDAQSLQLPYGYHLNNGVISNGTKDYVGMAFACESPKKSVVGQVKDAVRDVKNKVQDEVAHIQGSVAQKKALKKLNPLKFSDVKDYFDKYTIGTKNGKLIAIDRATDKVITDEDIVSKVHFASAWVEACGQDVSLSGVQTADGIDQRQYEYAFNKGAESTFNSLIGFISGNFGQKVQIEDMASYASSMTGYKYADSIVSALLTDHSAEQMNMIRTELSKSAHAVQIQNSQKHEM